MQSLRPGRGQSKVHGMSSQPTVLRLPVILALALGLVGTLVLALAISRGGTGPGGDSPAAHPPAAGPGSTSVGSTSVGTTSGSTASAPPASGSTASGSTPSTGSDAGCVQGTPVRMRIPSLEVDAGFERIGLDEARPDGQGRAPLGSPTDRTKAGWYVDGPQPGSGRGTVLTNGHTYRDGSAIFQEDFAERIDVGQLIDVEVDNGSTCSYRVQRVWRDVDAAQDYPRIVLAEDLYDFEGPERLFLTTCGGRWNSTTQSYDHISVLIATPTDRA